MCLVCIVSVLYSCVHKKNNKEEEIKFNSNLLNLPDTLRLGEEYYWELKCPSSKFCLTQNDTVLIERIKNRYVYFFIVSKKGKFNDAREIDVDNALIYKPIGGKIKGSFQFLTEGYHLLNCFLDDKAILYEKINGNNRMLHNTLQFMDSVYVKSDNVPR